MVVIHHGAYRTKAITKQPRANRIPAPNTATGTPRRTHPKNSIGFQGSLSFGIDLHLQRSLVFLVLGIPLSLNVCVVSPVVKNCRQFLALVGLRVIDVINLLTFLNLVLPDVV